MALNLTISHPNCSFKFKLSMCLQMVNRDLTKLSNWADQWRVTFNAAKTVYMIISNRKNINYPNLYLHGQVLTRVRTHKHLGMTFSDDMKWGAHIDVILKKAFSRLNGIRRLRNVIGRTVKETLYKSLVLPLVEYGSVLFDNCSAALKLRLERLHRHAAVIVTGAFRNTSFVRLLSELGWDSLDERSKLARLSLYKKMVLSNHAHKDNRVNEVLVPEYLSSMIPQSVGDRAGYVLRNASKLDTIKTRLVSSYNSFLPKTTRDWNLLLAENINFERLQQTTTIESFKACYKREFLRSPNPLFNVDNGGNMHQTRLRLGLSHLRAHLFQHNLIDNPICQFCNLEPETTSHYILRCPTYNNVRVRFLIGLTTVLDQDYMAGLNDDKIVNLFLYGDPLLNHNTNVDIISMAQEFIVDSKRFNLRILQ